MIFLVVTLEVILKIVNTPQRLVHIPDSSPYLLTNQPEIGLLKR
jgi:hypothetical protein